MLENRWAFEVNLFFHAAGVKKKYNTHLLLDDGVNGVFLLTYAASSSRGIALKFSVGRCK
jgi:hypothetical protein